MLCYGEQRTGLGGITGRADGLRAMLMRRALPTGFVALITTGFLERPRVGPLVCYTAGGCLG